MRGTHDAKLVGRHLAKDEGEGIWFIGSFMRFKATADSTGGAFTLIDEIAGPGRQSPPHIHHAEDEAFWIIEGEVTFACGDQTHVAGPGSFVFLPRDIQHWLDVALASLRPRIRAGDEAHRPEQRHPPQPGREVRQCISGK